jgi:hypothetical protein
MRRQPSSQLFAEGAASRQFATALPHQHVGPREPSVSPAHTLVRLHRTQGVRLAGPVPGDPSSPSQGRPLVRHVRMELAHARQARLTQSNVRHSASRVFLDPGG